MRASLVQAECALCPYDLQENLAIYKRLQGVKPSHDVNRDKLNKHYQAQVRWLASGKWQHCCVATAHDSGCAGPSWIPGALSAHPSPIGHTSPPCMPLQTQYGANARKFHSDIKPPLEPTSPSSKFGPVPLLTAYDPSKDLGEQQAEPQPQAETAPAAEEFVAAE